jgi:(p)ppGpp synthase/HD superfamily hydrolase
MWDSLCHIIAYNFVRVKILTFLHCVETATILATTRASFEVVATGLLHDVVDDFNLSRKFL